VILAHVAGIPVEEMLIPSAAGSGTALIIARTWLAFRMTRRRDRSAARQRRRREQA
jgi:serine kinase of HPr protein (carbohydrate metabolism regulator)